MAGRLELLAHDGVAGPGALELGADHLLRAPVGIADRGQVGLGVDDQVIGEEALHREPVHGVGEDVGQAQVVVVPGHGT